MVNSYHAQGLVPDMALSAIRILATAQDGTVEAMCMDGRPTLGLMWHPERESIPSEQDVALIRALFSLGPL